MGVAWNGISESPLRPSVGQKCRYCFSSPRTITLPVGKGRRARGRVTRLFGVFSAASENPCSRLFRVRDSNVDDINQALSLTGKRRESVLRRPKRSLLWMVAVVVAIRIVGLAGPSSAIAQSIDNPLNAPYARTVDDLLVHPSLLGDSPSSQSMNLEVAAAPSTPETFGLAAADQETGPTQRMDFARREKYEIEEYDPWEPYNEKMFFFNHDIFDRYLLKPAAKVWNAIVPDEVQQKLGNAIDNLGMPRRVVNNLLQAKFKGAGVEVTRFLINTTMGSAGLFDIAKNFGLEKRDEDTGQTLGFYGVGPGPYLILPILSPLTVRDAIGYAADVGLDPINYFIPFGASVGRRAGDVVNYRSQNLEFFESVEESTIDLYSAVRNAYLQRRQKAIEE